MAKRVSRKVKVLGASDVHATIGPNVRASQPTGVAGVDAVFASLRKAHPNISRSALALRVLYACAREYHLSILRPRTFGATASEGAAQRRLAEAHLRVAALYWATLVSELRGVSRKHGVTRAAEANPIARKMLDMVLIHRAFVDGDGGAS